DRIVDDMAHAIVQARLESRMHYGLDYVPVADFERVVQGLSRVAAVNQAIARGEIAQTADLTAIVDGIGPVAKQLQTWWELSYVAALVAQRGGDATGAIAFYESLKSRAALPAPPSQLAELVKSGEIDHAIENLSKGAASAGEANEDTSSKAAAARSKIEA